MATREAASEGSREQTRGGGRGPQAGSKGGGAEPVQSKQTPTGRSVQIAEGQCGGAKCHKGALSGVPGVQ